MSTPPYLNIRAKVEDAVKGYIAASSIPGAIAVYNALECLANDSVATMPFILVHCPSSAPWVPEANANIAGVHARTVSCQIDVVTQSADVIVNNVTQQSGRDFHSNVVGTILDYMLAGDAVAQLMAQNIDGLNVQDVALESESISAGDMKYETTLMFTINGGPI